MPSGYMIDMPMFDDKWLDEAMAVVGFRRVLKNESLTSSNQSRVSKAIGHIPIWRKVQKFVSNL